MKVVIVTGGRGFQSRDMVELELSGQDPDLVVHGACPTGADRFAHEWAVKTATPVLAWPADWDRHGPRAGPIRNEDMVFWVKEMPMAKRVGLVFAGGRGTAHCRRMMEKYGIEYFSLADEVEL